MAVGEHYDVVIIGAGLAGLSLARHLLLTSEKTILLVDKRATIPPQRQKVGEALTQVGGYYFSKVLDLEEHLLREHFMKYNLCFYWKSGGRDNRCVEDYSQAYIRPFSNIATYQLDRNKLEAELLRLNRENPRFTFWAPVTDLDVALAADGPHTLTGNVDGCAVVVHAKWVGSYPTARGGQQASRGGDAWRLFPGNNLSSSEDCIWQYLQHGFFPQ